MESNTKLLREWLQQLGCPVELSEKELQKLNSLKMKSIWRHLRTCVKPTFPAQTVKKNLLLSKLNSPNVSNQPTNFGNFKIESIQELTLVEEINNIQEEIDSLENKTEVLEHQLNSSSSALVMKNVEKKLLKDRLKELEDKSDVLELMANDIKENIFKMDEEIKYLSFCQFSPAPVSYLEMKQNQATVVKYIQQLSNMETEDESFISEILINIVQFSPITILKSLLFSSHISLQSLNSKLYQKFWSHEQNRSKFMAVIFSRLNAEFMTNETEIFHSSKEINKLTIRLENSIETLANTLEEGFAQSACDFEGEEVNSSRMMDIVNDFLNEKRQNKRHLKIRLLLEELLSCGMEIDYLKSTVNHNGEEKLRVQKVVDERVNQIDNCLQQILYRKESIKHFMSSISKKNSELASNFYTEYNLSKSDQNMCHFSSIQHLIQEEFELFQRIPLAALTRKWEDLSSILSEKVDEEFSKNSVLCSALFHSELKNVVLKLLERIYWFHNCD